MKLQMRFYLISSLEQCFPEDFNRFQINQYPYKGELKRLHINKQFYETDKEVEDNIRRLKVCGECSLEEFIEWEYLDYFCESCETLGSITLEYGWMPAISLSTEYEQDYSKGVYEGVNSYVTANPLILEGDYEKLTKLMQSQVNKWIKEWEEWIKDTDRDKENHPSETFYVDELQLELVLA